MLQFIKNLRRTFMPSPDQLTANALYNVLVGQSRQPGFYVAGGVADTLDGRFDMIVLHAFLVMRRLRDGGVPGEALSQALFDEMFADMDRSLREAGVGDLSIGKRIGKMGELFYGLLLNVNRALDADDRADMAGVLSRNFFEGETPESLDAFTAYVFDAARALDEQNPADILSGTLAFGPLP